MLHQNKLILNRVLYAKHILCCNYKTLASRFKPQRPEIKEESCGYPPIIDMSKEGLKRHYRQMWYDSVQALPSIELKLHELAVQQLMDLKTFNLSSVPPTYNGVGFQSYITRTHLLRGLPKMITDINVDQEFGEIKDILLNVLLNYYCSFWEENKPKLLQDFITEDNAGSKLVTCLISQCYKKLGLRNEYILNSTIQQSPRIRSFWWHSGFGKVEDRIHEKNLCFQFEDYAALCIRVKQPLLPILEMNDPLCSTAEVLDYHYHPDVFQIPSTTENNKLASAPGFWPGDPCDFPFLLVYSSDKLKSLTSQIKKYDLNKIEEGVGVMSSFAWLNAFATYQGFTPFQDVTYPIVTQTILTNGQDWKFFVYQLNTVAFHEDVDNKDRRNLCWSSDKLRLFDAVEDGQVKGINDEVFKVLLRFLHNAPQLREGVDLKPYLGEDTRSEEDKIHLRYYLRKMYSRIPNLMAHRNEVPAWVKIYKLHKDAPPTPFVRLE